MIEEEEEVISEKHEIEGTSYQVMKTNDAKFGMVRQTV